MSQPDLFGRAADARDDAIAAVSANAEGASPGFAGRARDLILQLLGGRGSLDAEALTDACLEAGIRPHDLRAFGGVFMGLTRAGLIERTGEMRRRRRGHLTTGNSVWRLTAKGGAACQK